MKTIIALVLALSAPVAFAQQGKIEITRADVDVAAGMLFVHGQGSARSPRPWSSTGPSWTCRATRRPTSSRPCRKGSSRARTVVVVRAPGNASASMDVTIGGGGNAGVGGLMGPAGPTGRRARGSGRRDGTSGTRGEPGRGGRLDRGRAGPGGPDRADGAGRSAGRAGPGGPDRADGAPQVRRESRAWRARPGRWGRLACRVSSRSRSRRPSVRAPPGPRRSWPRARVARRRSQAALAPRSPTRSSAPTPRTMAVTGSASSASCRPRTRGRPG